MHASPPVPAPVRRTALTKAAGLPGARSARGRAEPEAGRDPLPACSVALWSVREWAKLHHHCSCADTLLPYAQLGSRPGSS